MVENAYKVALVAAFVPLACGVYWTRATRHGAPAAISTGVSSWILLEYLAPDGMWPPQLAGLLMSLGGMLCGSLPPQHVRPARPIGESGASILPVCRTPTSRLFKKPL